MRLKRTWKKVEVTVETHEFLALVKGQSILSYCPQCTAQVHMLSPERAAQVTDVGLGTIDQWIKAGKVHFSELGKGERLICGNSLAAQTPIQPCGRSLRTRLMTQEQGTGKGTSRKGSARQL